MLLPHMGEPDVFRMLAHAGEFVNMKVRPRIEKPSLDLSGLWAGE
jgi:hypothetical protein